MKYPLAPLLRVRHYREDAAQMALRSAERAVVEAEEAVERCREELKRYHDWRQEEIERRYAAIMNVSLSLKDLDAFKGGLGVLAEAELQREQAVAKAAQRVDVCRTEVVKAKEGVRHAQRETAKIVAHKDVWMKEAAHEASRLEDLEMEEFKPLPPQSFDDEDSPLSL